MLKNNLYKVLALTQNGDGTYVAEVVVDPAHALFEGHFPGQPVLPGVCLLEMLKEILAEIKNTPLRLTNAASIKYLKLVDPRTDSSLRFEIKVADAADGFVVNASSFVKDGTANFKIKANFA